MSSKPKRALVAGGGGFIGRNVVSAFLEAGVSVRVLDVVDGARDGVEWIVGSLSDSALLTSAVADTEAVVCLASSSLPGMPHDGLSGEIESHVLPTVRAAEICSSHGVRKFLFASSGGTVYGQSPEAGKGLEETAPTSPRNAYGISKLAIEQYLRQLSAQTPMQAVSLRISNPYGEGQKALRGQGVIAAAMQHAMEGTVMPIWGDGSVERDFLHVSDVARAFLLASQYDGAEPVFKIGSGVAVSLREVLTEVERATGKELNLKFEENRAIDVKRSCLSIERARHGLGWSPGVILGEGLRRTADWWANGCP